MLFHYVTQWLFSKIVTLWQKCIKLQNEIKYFKKIFSFLSLSTLFGVFIKNLGAQKLPFNVVFFEANRIETLGYDSNCQRYLDLGRNPHVDHCCIFFLVKDTSTGSYAPCIPLLHIIPCQRYINTSIRLDSLCRHCYIPFFSMDESTRLDSPM